MLEFFHVIILAVVQALTEFLPISSSGHLVIMQNILGFKEANISLNIMLHMGTLLAVIVYFFKDLLNILFDCISALGELFQGSRPSDILYRNPNLKLFLFSLIACIPAGIVVLFFHDLITSSFESLLVVGCSLIFTGVIVYFTKNLISEGKDLYQFKVRDSFWIGVAQSLAILPGVSRSGMTIATGLARGLDRELAFKFSFILSIPTILAAFVFDLENMNKIEMGQLVLYLVGAFVSFVLGLLAIKILSKIIMKGNFYLFSYYCFFVGVMTIIVHFFQK